VKTFRKNFACRMEKAGAEVVRSRSFRAPHHTISNLAHTCVTGMASVKKQF
jgi:hypothetical protein